MVDIPVDFQGVRLLAPKVDGERVISPSTIRSAAKAYLRRTGADASMAYVGPGYEVVDLFGGMLVIVSEDLDPGVVWAGRLDRAWGDERYRCARSVNGGQCSVDSEDGFYV